WIYASISVGVTRCSTLGSNWSTSREWSFDFRSTKPSSPTGSATEVERCCSRSTSARFSSCSLVSSSTGSSADQSCVCVPSSSSNAPGRALNKFLTFIEQMILRRRLQRGLPGKAAQEAGFGRGLRGGIRRYRLAENQAHELFDTDPDRRLR